MQRTHWTLKKVMAICMQDAKPRSHAAAQPRSRAASAAKQLEGGACIAVLCAFLPLSQSRFLLVTNLFRRSSGRRLMLKKPWNV